MSCGEFWRILQVDGPPPSAPAAKFPPIIKYFTRPLFSAALFQENREICMLR